MDQEQGVFPTFRLQRNDRGRAGWTHVATVDEHRYVLRLPKSLDLRVAKAEGKKPLLAAFDSAVSRRSHAAKRAKMPRSGQGSLRSSRTRSGSSKGTSSKLDASNSLLGLECIACGKYAITSLSLTDAVSRIARPDSCAESASTKSRPCPNRKWHRGVTLGFISMSQTTPVPSSITKSKPKNPDKPRRRASRSAASNIS